MQKRKVEIEVTGPQDDILQSTAQRNLFHSGAGSGKSHCIGLIAGDYAKNNPWVRGLIAANTYGQLTKSTLDRVFKVWEEILGWRRNVHYVVDRIPPDGFKIIGPKLKTYENTISFANGALIFTASLDNYKVIDGTEFGWACLDETKDTKEEAVREVIVARLRQPGMYVNSKGVLCDDWSDGCTGFNPLYIFTSPAKIDWISEWFDLPEYFDEINSCIFSETDYFRKRKGDKMVVISSTYHNKHNLSPGYIERMIEDNKHNPHRVKMLVYGSPLAKAGHEFYNQFDRMKHVKVVPFRDDSAVHISLDFNVVPYITMTCWQLWFDTDDSRWKWHGFDEICLKSPHNNTEDLCKELVRRHGHRLKRGLFYYGDYSGYNRRTNSKENPHDYITVDRELRKFISPHSCRVVPNPSVSGRRDFLNKIFAGNLPIDISVDPRMKNTIADFEFLQEAPDGTKLKKKVKDPDSQQMIEKYGHTSDTVDYIGCEAFNQYKNR